MSGVALKFELVKQKLRFLDRKIADHLSPVKKRFFMRAGGAIRTTARRLLRKARQKTVSELTVDERIRWEQAKDRYAAGEISRKPRRPDAISQPGNPPLLHSTGSPLKSRLFFSLASDGNSVVIGPEAIGRNATQSKRGGLSSLRELEKRRPFMDPAYERIEPRLPGYLASAARL